MITLISTGSYTDSYPVTFGGIQVGEFSVLEELARQKLTAPIHLIVIRQSRQNKEECLFGGGLYVHRINKPYPFDLSTDTEFRTAFAIEAKRLAHRLVVNSEVKVFQLCSAVPARCFLEWDMSDSFYEGKRPKFVYSAHNALTLAKEPAGSFSTKVEEWNIQKKAELEIIGRADKVICTSQSFKNFISKEYGLYKNIVYIPNTVGSHVFFDKVKKIDDSQWSRTILFLGRLSGEKRVDRIIETFDLLVKRGYDYSLIIAGDGGERDRIERLIEKKNLRLLKEKKPLPRTVHMIGMVTDKTKWRILKSARVMICLSDYEVSPLVGYESLALGVPVIASDLDQWREIIKDNQNGFIVDGRDIQTVANRTIQLIESEKIYRMVSRNNKERYKDKFDSKIIAQKRYDLVYSHLLEL